MGYTTYVGSGIGHVNAIMRVPRGFEGVADPRGAGRPAGY
jgi:gamma-glutamyltranspeptidase